MKKRNLVMQTAILLVLSMVAPVQAQQPQPTNIIFIMADDLGYGDLGSYGQKMIQTPHLDRLAAEGIRFTQAYAGSTVCAPSRSSLMTGMHNGHNRLRDNLPHEVWLRPDDFTVAEMLKQAGYKTGAIGKWSLGNPGSWGIANYQGFDYFYGHLSQDQAHFYYPDYLWENDKVVLLQKRIMVDGIGKSVGNKGGNNALYTHDLFTEKALAFIDRYKEDPFFLYLPFTIPHFSDYARDTAEVFIVPSDEPYTDRDWPQISKNYAAMITRMDRDIGKIMQKLKDHGIDQNTLVIFTSDNGPYDGSVHEVEFFDSNGPLQGVKRQVYEGGIRVPFIARWPGRITPGGVSDQVFAFWDMMPTIAEIAGLPIPEGIDGISMLPAFLGQPQEGHEYLYWDYGHVRNVYMQAVRWEDWKGIRVGVGSPIELYDLSTDIGEEKDVSGQHPEIVARIERYFEEAVVPSPDYPIKSATR